MPWNIVRVRVLKFSLKILKFWSWISMYLLQMVSYFLNNERFFRANASKISERKKKTIRERFWNVHYFDPSHVNFILVIQNFWERKYEFENWNYGKRIAWKMWRDFAWQDISIKIYRESTSRKTVLNENFSLFYHKKW